MKIENLPPLNRTMIAALTDRIRKLAEPGGLCALHINETLYSFAIEKTREKCRVVGWSAESPISRDEAVMVTRENMPPEIHKPVSIN